MQREAPRSPELQVDSAGHRLGVAIAQVVQGMPEMETERWSPVSAGAYALPKRQTFGAMRPAELELDIEPVSGRLMRGCHT